MPVAKISTTEPMTLLVNPARVASHVKMIEDIYHISVKRFELSYDPDITEAIFHGLDDNIRQFLKDEENVTDDSMADYVSETSEMEVPFWNLGVMTDYLLANGWRKRLGSPTHADLNAQRYQMDFIKFISPVKAVLIDIPIFSRDPEEVNVFIINNEDSDFTAGTQFLKESEIHQIDLGEVVTMAEKYLTFQ